ncbi:homospermidine synthase [Legionella israelensis]|uniref:homospermidine synthase n=1 Tax=Legionella israelensis TaxID=454 RepID=UPI0011810E76|nr:saccharopine dehydrogenase C-terminal domain-containing protein [Legionella israelensis]QDP73240.1 homospermidine synthase [Legionella israelensis]
MKNNHKKYIHFPNKIILLGFGSIGQAVLPLLLRHLELSASKILIMTKEFTEEPDVSQYGINIEEVYITKENYMDVLENKLDKEDFLLNLSVDISSVDLIKFCQRKGALYLDASTEPWEGGYVDRTLPSASRSNYALREEVLKLKPHHSPTAVLTHGANPGLVSHFVKQALWNIAKDNQLNIEHPETSSEWAKLAKSLDIKVIHIAERDTQISHKNKSFGEFVNTWSVEGFISEAGQPAELSWGSHERHWPEDASHHTTGSQSAIYLERPGASVKVRSWTPTYGPYHGFLITHAEAISIGSYLTLNDKEYYRPTVHYAYSPCPDAILSLDEFQGSEWYEQKNKRLLFDEITEGVDELGVLLMGHAKGAYWYGSTLSVHEARELVPYNNATSLQVAAGILAGLIWAIKNPNQGIVEPEEMDYQFILDIALPYLGEVGGYYTDWTPLKERERLFKERLDSTDPWQFINIRVN